MYTTANLSNLDNLFEMFFTNDFSTYKKLPSHYEAKVLEDGKLQATFSVLGHDIKNIKLYVTDEEVSIKAKKEENTSKLVEDIDITFSVGADYDGTKTEAKFSNGLLILTIDKKEERKAKSISIKVG